MLGAEDVGHALAASGLNGPWQRTRVQKPPSRGDFLEDAHPRRLRRLPAPAGGDTSGPAPIPSTSPRAHALCGPSLTTRHVLLPGQTGPVPRRPRIRRPWPTHLVDQRGAHRSAGGGGRHGDRAPHLSVICQARPDRTIADIAGFLPSRSAMETKERMARPSVTVRHRITDHKACAVSGAAGEIPSRPGRRRRRVTPSRQTAPGGAPGGSQTGGSKRRLAGWSHAWRAVGVLSSPHRTPAVARAKPVPGWAGSHATTRQRVIGLKLAGQLPAGQMPNSLWTSRA